MNIRTISALLAATSLIAMPIAAQANTRAGSYTFSNPGASAPAAFRTAQGVKGKNRAIAGVTLAALIASVAGAIASVVAAGEANDANDAVFALSNQVTALQSGINSQAAELAALKAQGAASATALAALQKSLTDNNTATQTALTNLQNAINGLGTQNTAQAAQLTKILSDLTAAQKKLDDIIKSLGAK